MLAKYLKEIRASKVISSSQALGQLGAGWTQGEGGALEKQFLFDDHVQASNFMQRYTDYCQKVNMVPQWQNVYNRVSVRLESKEFGGVTTKELSAGNFLDKVASARLTDVDENLPFERVQEIA